jgi:hypothetical protein
VFTRLAFLLFPIFTNSLNKSSERRANSFGHWDRPPRLTSDEDVYEVARCGRKSFSLFEDSKFVANARISQLANAQPDFYHLGKSQRLEVLTLRLCGNCDDFAGCDIQPTFSNEILVDCRVEESVVQLIVYVALEVVVHPTRRQRQKVRIL